MRIRFLVAASLLTGSLYAADPQLLGLCMPDSQMMAGMNVTAALLSPTGQYAVKQVDTMQAAELQKLIDTTGFDPRRDLQEVLVSLKSQKNSTTGVVLGRGTFDIPRLLEAAQATGGTMESYKGISIVKESKDDAIAFPNSTLAIFGDEPEVRAAIDRLTAPATLPPALLAQVQKLSGSEDVWFFSTLSPTQLQGTNAAAAGPAAIFDKTQQFSFGVKFGSDVVLSLQSVSQTDADAAAVAAVLKGLTMGISGGGTNSNPQMAALSALLQNLNITSDGNTTNLRLAMPETLIEQQYNQRMPAVQPTPKKAVPHKEQSQSAAPAAPQASLAVVEGGKVPQRIRVGSAIQKAKLLGKVDPVYPPLAQQARVSGTVVLNAVIEKDGTVGKLTVLSGHPLLVQSAMDAVKQWNYQPTLLNGQPVEVLTQIEVPFQLSE